ncbi:MAG: hypothetical protein AB2535_11150 [Candidatus Thiodiazotropha endolucinida]
MPKHLTLSVKPSLITRHSQLFALAYFTLTEGVMNASRKEMHSMNSPQMNANKRKSIYSLSNSAVWMDPILQLGDAHFRESVTRH